MSGQSECVALIGEASTTARWSDSLAASCESLVDPTIADQGERALRGRMIAILAGSPFIVGGATMLAFADRVSPQLVFGSVSAILGLSFLALLGAARAKRAETVGLFALAATSLVLAAVAGIGGGLLSPLVLLLAAPAIELRLLDERTTVRNIGIACSAASVVAAAALASLAGPGSVSAWHWIAPLAYAATVWLRLPAARPAQSAAHEVSDSMLQDTLDAVILKLDASGDVVDASRQASDILGLQPELLLGNGLFERIHVGDRVAYLCAVSALREAPGTQHVEAKLRLPGAGGKGTEFRLHRIEMIAVDGRDGITAVLRNASDVQALRDRLAEARDAAESIDVAKGRFLASVSHELRTPLNAIIGFSDVLLHEMFGPFKDARQREYVSLIKESGDHLLSLVNSILDVSKIEAGAYTIHAEPFAFSDAVDMCHSMMAGQARDKKLRFRNTIGNAIGEIHADRRAVQQILINLLSNAIKFTPEGGDVTIGGGRVGSRLTFWVADSGIGIAPDDLERLGQPFMQVQNDYTRHFEGTGLGLSLVKGLVTLHKGTMSIESAPGEGTTVSVSLPVDGAQQDTIGESTRTTTATVVPFGETEIDHGPLRKTA